MFDVSAPVAGFEITSDSGALVSANAPFAGGNQASGLLLIDGPTFTTLSVLSMANDPDIFAAGTLGTAISVDLIDGFSLNSIVDVSSFASLTDLPDDLSASFVAADNTVFVDVPLTFINIPEPATAGVLGVVALGMLRRRRAA